MRVEAALETLCQELTGHLSFGFCLEPSTLGMRMKKPRQGGSHLASWFVISYILLAEVGPERAVINDFSHSAIWFG